ncbi:MAG: response regulator transcription factor, partial [Acidimicrobiales bacterium]
LLPHLRDRDRTGRRPDALTDRELTVLRLLEQGSSNAVIASELVISVNTVRNHVQSVLSKLGAHSKLEAVARARSSGLLGPSSSS